MKTRRDFVKGAAGAIMAPGLANAAAKSARIRNSGVTRARAQAVHDTALIFDGHNDVPVERVHRGEKTFGWKQRDPAYHTDIPRMREGGYGGGFFIVGDGPTANVWVTIEQVLRQVEALPEDLVLVRSSGDAVRARQSRKIGVLMAIEGAGRWLDGKLDILGILYRLGVRSVGITHGEGGPEPNQLQGTRSPYGRCTPEDRIAGRTKALGLTAFGKQVLKANNEMGIVTDLAHINDKAFYEVLELSSRPSFMSHSGVFALSHHWRCLTDDQIKALAGAGGVVGIAFAPEFIHADPRMATIDRLVEHICYVADLVGIDYVGVGTDFDGLGETIPVVPDVSQLVRLTQAMLAQGLTEEEIRKVWGGNVLRLLEKNIDRPGRSGLKVSSVCPAVGAGWKPEVNTVVTERLRNGSVERGIEHRDLWHRFSA